MIYANVINFRRVTSNLQKCEKHRKTKKQFPKRIGVKYGFVLTRIEQNNDHTGIWVKYNFVARLTH